jgi:hypothetical protein
MFYVASTQVTEMICMSIKKKLGTLSLALLKAGTVD